MVSKAKIYNKYIKNKEKRILLKKAIKLKESKKKRNRLTYKQTEKQQPENDEQMAVSTR